MGTVLLQRGFSLGLVCMLSLLTISSSADADILVAEDSVWKYLDNGSNQLTAWKESGFIDTGWSSGAAELGYGDGDETTVVSYGDNANNKHITTYFRQSFNVTDASIYESLTLDILYDDGAVVYLNGTELTRVGMPGGMIYYNTPASVGDEYPWYTEVFDTSLLVSETNVIAVEIHQASGTSSDISFDLELTASTENSIVIVGVADEQVYVDTVSFTVNSLVGYDYTATLNGVAIATDVEIVVDEPDFYELYVHRQEQPSGPEDSVLIHFVVSASERGVSEWGLPKWTPYPQIPSAAAEFVGAQLQIVAPDEYPMGLEIPIIARVEDTLGDRVGVNGMITATGFEAYPLRLLRGVGSVFLPAATNSNPISYTAEIHSLQTAKQITIESSTTWQSITTDLTASANWGEGARVQITSSVGSAFTIPAGATLTIGAGSVIVIDPDLEIEVLGNIVVNGTLERPVVFTSQDRDIPWGGFLLEAGTSQGNITGAILTASGADPSWFSTHHSGDHRHRSEQCLFYLSDGANLTLTNCYMVENHGQIGHSEGSSAAMSMYSCLVQKCITTGQYNYGTVTLDDTALIEFPSADSPFVDGDNDAIYLTGSSNTHTVTDCLIGWTLDDGIDSMGRNLNLSNCWFESIYHDAMAMSSATIMSVTGTVYLNNGQALECGWNDPTINATNTFCTANVVGARFGDCYGSYYYHGFLDVTDSLLLYNIRDIWNWTFDLWQPSFAYSDVHDNYLSAPNPDYPDNSLWDPISDPNQTDLLLPFMPSPVGNVGIGLATRKDTFDLAELSDKIPVRLSTFTTNTVSVAYNIDTEDGPYDSGTLTFIPGESLKFIQFTPPPMENLFEVTITLSSPLNADITGYDMITYSIPYEVVVPLILEGDQWRYFKGSTEPPADWNQLSFNDSAWLTGATGIGYEASSGYESCIATNLSDMQNNYMSVYARRIFDIDDTSRLKGLSFTIDFDDGYIAYINGLQVHSQYPPSTVAYDQPASAGHEACCGCTQVPIDLSDYIGDLVPGDNVLAIQVHNFTLDSSDFIFIPELFALFTPHPGDFEPDGDVDINDFAILTSAWLSDSSDANYNPFCDMNTIPDYNINILDLEVFAQYWLSGF